MAENAGKGQPRGESFVQMTPDERVVLEIEFEDLDDICGGVVGSFGRGMQPDGGAAGAHH